MKLIFFFQFANPVWKLADQHRPENSKFMSFWIHFQQSNFGSLQVRSVKYVTKM